jgi:hypothetical protein
MLQVVLEVTAALLLLPMVLAVTTQITAVGLELLTLALAVVEVGTTLVGTAALAVLAL